MSTTASRISRKCLSCEREFFLPLPEDPDQREWAMRLQHLVRYCSACVERTEARERDRDLQRAQRAVVASSGLPEGLRHLSFDQLDRTNGRGEVIDAAVDWIGAAGGFFVASRPGTGKTRLAATIASALAADRSFDWVNAPALFTKAQSSFRSDERAHAERVLFARRPLFLDDLGKENPSEWARQMLQTALEDRLTNGVHVFITSNESPAQLGAKYGAWLASRLAGSFRQFVMPGPDRRLRLVT